MNIDKRSAAGTEQTAGIIDCDVHPVLGGGFQSLYPHMPIAWRERFKRKRAQQNATSLTMRFQHPNGAVIREDSRPGEGRAGGSDPHFMLEDLIEPHGLEKVVLNNLQIGGLCAVLSSVDESIVIASAANDHYREEWLRVDARFTYAAVVSPQDPQAAASEIRRVATWDQVSAIALPPLAFLLGNRYWWPIFEAAQECDLPILLHVTGAEGIYQGAPMPAGGQPDTYIERYVTLSQPAEANLVSMLMNGTFERFPRLRVLFVEYGFVWPIPSLLRMDRLWRGLRHEVPWVKQPPSEYLEDHVWFTTQPIEEPKNPEDLSRLVEMVGVGNLCFSTDYPHWDNDMPMQSLRSLASGDRDRIMRQNARNVLRLSEEGVAA